MKSEDDEESNMNGRVLGLCIGAISAFCNGTGTVMTRSLKEVPASIILWYYGLFGIISTTIYIVIQVKFLDVGFLMQTYSQKLWLLLLLASVFNTATTTCRTIAFQSDTSGFVVLFGNISLVYMFLCDSFFFKESFSKVELSGILIILTVVISIAIYKVCEKNKAKS